MSVVFTGFNKGFLNRLLIDVAVVLNGKSHGVGAHSEGIVIDGANNVRKQDLHNNLMRFGVHVGLFDLAGECVSVVHDRVAVLAVPAVNFL